MATSASNRGRYRGPGGPNGRSGPRGPKGPPRPPQAIRSATIADRRIAILFGVFLLLLIGITLRAGWLGVFKSGWLKDQEAEEHIQMIAVPAVRGTITDSNGIALAISVSTDDVIADPMLIDKAALTPVTAGQTASPTPAQIARRLAPLLGISFATLSNQLNLSKRGYVVLAANVSHATAVKIDAMNINGISLTPTESRYYPRGTEAAQLLGFTNINEQNQAGAQAGKAAAQVGLSGVEQEFNSSIAGTAGEEKTINVGTAKPISIQTVQAEKSGESIQLTINSALQDKVESILAGVGAEYSPKNATAIVMDPQTGKVLALANWPTYNPNQPLTKSEYENNSVDQAVSLSYEPGSTFKAITVAGALQDGLITPSTNFTIPSVLQINGKQIHDAESHGTEVLSVAQILKVSSNIGADEIGEKMGVNRFKYWVNKFGFGSQTGIDLPDEQIGIVPNSENFAGAMTTMPFGQGVEVTPIQLASAYSAIANGGILRKPEVIQSIDGKTRQTSVGTRVISATVAAEVRNMLRGVLADGGTASGAAINGYDLAGKTGTADVVVNGSYSKTDYIASFVGMVPASDPKLVVAVVVNDPKTTNNYGGTVAAPVFRQIVSWAVPYFGINPCPSPCPPSAYTSTSSSTS